jgi:hypothetical protein
VTSLSHQAEAFKFLQSIANINDSLPALQIGIGDHGNFSRRAESRTYEPTSAKNFIRAPLLRNSAIRMLG